MQDWLATLPRKARALLLLACGLGALGVLLGMDLSSSRGKMGLAFMAPVCLVLGIGGMVRPEIIGRDDELAPGDRPIQIAVVVVGVLLGFVSGWFLGLD